MDIGPIVNWVQAGIWIVAAIVFFRKIIHERKWSEWRWWPRSDSLLGGLMVLGFIGSAVSLWLNYRPSSDDEMIRKYSAVAKENGQLKDVVAVKDSEIMHLKQRLEEQPQVVYRDKIVTQTIKQSEPSKEFLDTKAALENRTKELEQANNDAKQKLERLNALEKEKKEKAEEALAKKSAIEALVGQLSSLEKQIEESTFRADPYVLRAYMTKYNEIVKSGKKELPTDSYMQNVEEAAYGTYGTIKTQVLQLRIYFEQRYLK